MSHALNTDETRTKPRAVGRRLITGGVLAGLLLGLGLAARKWLLPPPATALVLRRAIASFDAKDTETAVRLLDEILAREPTHHTALLYRGYVARDSGETTEAARFWSRVPDDPPHEGGTARYLEGLLALSEHRARDAERLLRRATELHPTFLPPRESLANLYLWQLRDGEMRREMAVIRARRPWSLDELIASVGSHGKIHPVTIRTREAKGVAKIPNAALRYRPSPPMGPDGKPVPQPPEAPLAKGQGRVYLVTSDKPGDEKDEQKLVSIGITDGMFTEIANDSLAVGTKVVTDETDQGDDKKKKKGIF